MKVNFKAFRAWVAEPAFRASSPEAAVEHVVRSVGPSVQLKAEFLSVVAAVPNGFDLLVRAVTEELVDLVPRGGSPALARAVEHLQRSQRFLFRFAAFHPDPQAVERVAGVDRLSAVLDLGFHADNLVTVSCMAADGESGGVKAAVLNALAAAADDFAERYHSAVRDLVEEVAGTRDAARSFEPSTVADLLALPPFDGPAATVEEMNESIGSMHRCQ